MSYTLEEEERFQEFMQTDNLPGTAEEVETRIKLGDTLLEQANKDLLNKLKERAQQTRTRSQASSQAVKAMEDQEVIIKGVIEQIETMLKALDQLWNRKNRQNLKSQYNPESLGSGAGDYITQDSNEERERKRKEREDTMKVPTTLPTFKKGKNSLEDPDIFLEEFEAVMEANNFPRRRWLLSLKAQCNSIQAKWIQSDIIDTNKNWDEAREIFQTKSLSAQHKFFKQKELNKLKKTDKDTIIDYVDKFNDLITASGMDKATATLPNTFLESLDEDTENQIRLALMAAGQEPELDICQAMAKATYQQKENKQPSKTKTKSASSTKDKAGESSKKKYCTKHGKCAHDTKECRSLNKKPSVEESKTEKKKDKDLSHITCNKCKQQGHYANKCPELNKTPSINMINSPGSFEDCIMEEYEENDQAAREIEESISMVLQESKTNSKIMIPVLLGGKKVLGVYDSASDYTVIDTELAKTLGLKAGKAKEVQLAEQGNTVKIQVTDTSIQFKAGSYKEEINPAIMNLSGDTTLLIGRDLATRMGIQVTGIPTNYPEDQAVTQKEEDPEQRDLLVFGDNEEYAASRKKLMEAIQPLLAENEQIKMGTFCNHPAAIARFDTGDAPPNYQKQYPIPIAARAKVKAQIKEWEETGIIRQTKPGCRWNNPLCTSSKKNAEGDRVDVRVNFDGRKLNKLLIAGDKHPLPTIEDTHERYAGDNYFTAYDLKLSFNQFKVFEEHCEKTAFTYEGIQYEFVGAPFGTTPLSHVVTRTIQSIFKDLHFVSSFIDDITVHSKTLEEHIQHNCIVIKRLNKYNLKLRIDKCHFCYRSILNLGYRVSGEGILPDPKKVGEAMEWKTPTTGKQIQAFLGLMNFFRDSIPGFAHISGPLDQLRGLQDITHLWTPQHEAAFNQLKLMLSSAPIISHPRPDQPFTLATDASDFGVGAALYQEYDNQIHYIKFVSTTLKGGQQHYSATKRELLAIIYAVNKLHRYLWGRRFKVVTDHRALTYIYTQNKPNQMILRWFDTISEYDMEIVHCPGVKHILPDALSRLYPPTQADQNRGEEAICSIAKPVNIKEILKEVHDVTTPEEAERNNIINEEHQLGHFGTETMLRNLWKDRKVYWEGMRKDVEKVTSTCEPCMRYNIARHGFYPQRSIEAEGPMDHLAIDLGQPGATTVEGNNYILLIVDIATRFVWLRAITSKLPREVAWTLLEIFTEFGFPKILQSDNGTEFINSIITEMKALFQIKGRQTTPYHPQANGIAERHIGIAKNMVYKHIQGEDTMWDKTLLTVQTAINCKVSKATGSTPFSLMFGRSHNLLQNYNNSKRATRKSTMKTPAQLQERYKQMTSIIYPVMNEKMREEHDQRSKYFAKQNKIIQEPYPVGSTVMTLNKNRRFKSEPRYEGPFKVVRVTQANTHVLQDRTGEILQRNYTISELKLVADVPTEFGNSEEIQKILKHRGPQGNHEYLVLWKNAGGATTWEPESSFDDTAALTQYWRQLKPTSTNNSKKRTGRGSCKTSSPSAQIGQKRNKEILV